MFLSALLDLGHKQTLEIKLKKGPINTGLTDQSLSTKKYGISCECTHNHINMEKFFCQSHTDYMNTLDTKHGGAPCTTGSVL